MLLYDNKNITRNKGVVGVWSKMYPGSQGTEKQKNLYYDYEKIYEVDFLTEFNCSKSKFRQPKIVVYDIDGNVLNEISNSSDKDSWDYIVPDTSSDTLKNKICTKALSKQNR